jgi:hypothetical protein
MPTAKEMAELVIQQVKAYVAKALEPFDQRLLDAESMIKAIPEPIAPDVGAIAKAAAALIPVPKDGEPGKDAEPIDQAEVIKEVLAQIPTPEKGKDAEPLDQESVVKEVLAQIRQPEDGKSITIEDIIPLLQKMQAEWALDFERRAQDLFQKAVDKIPTPKDGVDGFGFDDMSVDYDGERGLTIKFSHGDRVKEFPFTLPIVIDRGVFKEGSAEYVKGDGVTWAGSFFIAQKDNPEGKPGESDAWRLSIKRGRDGKNYEPRTPNTGGVKL